MNLKSTLCLFLFQCFVIYLNEITANTTNNHTIFEKNDRFVKEHNSSLKRSVNHDNSNTFIQTHDDITDNFLMKSNLSGLDNLLEIWNPKTLANIWSPKQIQNFGITATCKMDIETYLAGVLNDDNWALRMMDASGKHNWGLFSGSRYWTGAPHQCREMANDFIQWDKNADNGIISNSEIPPFEVAVIGINLILDILTPGINGSHEIVLGLCLPRSCNVQDVEKLLDFAVNRSETNNLPRTIMLDHIRNLSEGYVIWEDKTFYIILAVYALVTVLIVLGTMYDIALRYKVLRRENQVENNSNVITEVKFSEDNKHWIDDVTFKKLWSVKVHNGSLDVCNSKDMPKPLSEALLSFSLLLNLSKVMSLDVGSDTLAPIHGLRFYSMMWIILVHTCLTYNEISDTKMFRSKAEDDFLYQTISNGNYSVDTFFVISGCLVSFLYFRTIAKERMKENKVAQGRCGRLMQFFGMMGYRYLRLTPPYLLMIGMIQVSMKWYHDHALIELPAQDYRTCEQFWWRHALYINTYFDMDDRCMVWSWYLANDTQFYTIGIIILIISASYFAIGAVIVIIFLIISWITTAIITLHTEHTPSIQDPFAHYESLYDKPWTRIGPYLIGMAAGWYLYKVNCKIKMHKAVIVLGWTLSFTMMTSIIYGLYGNMFGPVLSALYTALSHSGWAISIAWMVVATVTGNGGPINTLLSWKYIYPLSRLTYCAYLVHPAITRSLILRAESSLHLTQDLMATLFFGIAVSSYAVSLFLSLFFEAPMVSLLRIVHPLRQWKRH